MKKSIITLLLALFLTPVAALAETPKPAAVGSDPNTVTVSRAYLDSLLDSVAQARSQRDIAAQATQQVADQLRSEMESRYNTYVTHVGWLIALFALIPGLVVPILINRRFEDEIKNSIKAHDKKIKAQESAMDESNTRIKEATVDIQKVQTAVTAAEKNIQDKIATHDKAIEESNTRITETEESIQKVKTAVEESAQEAKIFALFSQAYYEKDLDNQIDLYTQILDIDPSYAEAYNNRGIVYGIKGECDEAIKDYTQAIALKKDFAEAYNNRGSAYGIKGVYDKAIEDFTQAIALKKDYAKAYNNRGIAYCIKGECDEAIEDFTQAIALKNDDAEAYNNRGIAYRKKGEYGKAIEDCTQAIKFDPEKASYYDSRADAYMIMENYAEALKDVEEGLNRNPNDEVRKLLEEKQRICQEKPQG